MKSPNISSSLLLLFKQSLCACQELYVGSARWCIECYPEWVDGNPSEFVELMDDLHRGLLTKIYVTVAHADKRWTAAEEECARVLFEHVWHRSLSGEALRQAIIHVTRQAAGLKWYALLRPFEKITPLKSRVGDLETVVIRLANLLAKADGEITASEKAAITEIHAHLLEAQGDLDSSLSPRATIPISSESSGFPLAAGSQTVATVRADAQVVQKQCELPSSTQRDRESYRIATESLDDVLAELDQLIGIEKVKQEIRTLANFLKVQKFREQAGLPTTPLSLHMVFEGNPGTGKTTVARLVGRILRSLGVLQKGHVIEIDRSGLVAEYAGQTSVKANKTIDNALDGILFIDEAYSLVAESGDDPFGNEAVQTLLKRMEDDRQRLIVILAGYPEPMDRLLRSNPGISSRFSYRITFPDYLPVELGQIFEIFCNKSQYVIPADARGKILLGFQYLFEQRDEHFGNGRLARNVFEKGIRHLADRIIHVAPLTKELLTTFEPDDILMEKVPKTVWSRFLAGDCRFRILCEGCGVETEMPQKYLGRRMQCKKCQHCFVAGWGEPL